MLSGLGNSALVVRAAKREDGDSDARLYGQKDASQADGPTVSIIGQLVPVQVGTGFPVVDGA